MTTEAQASPRAMCPGRSWVISPVPPFSTDVNECLHSELQACSGGAQCRNLEGSYQCVSPQQPTTSPSQPLNRTGEGNAGARRRPKRDEETVSRVDGLQISGTIAVFPRGCAG